jgi:hypothetical protein
MLLDILLLMSNIEMAIGNSAHVTFSPHGGRTFPIGFKFTVEWIVEGQLIRLEHIVPVVELEQAHNISLETFIIKEFIGKAKVGYQNKLYEMRSKIETEIRNAAKTKEYQD